MTALDQPRWAVYGIVDGAVFGAVTGFGLMLVTLLVYGDSEVGYLLLGALYGGGIGFSLGFLGGLMIDAVRAMGATDTVAAWAVMTPLVGIAAWYSHASLALVAPAAAVVAADLVWRLARLRRRSVTG